jgi:predicted NBD/HSP70 family sugar kinase
MAGGSITQMRRRNRTIVLQEIVSSAPVSRSQISKSTGLTGAAISRITRELIEVGLICEGKTVEIKGQVGRRNIRLELVDNGAFVLGIALTANAQSVSIGNSKGVIVAQCRVVSMDLSDPAVVVEQLSRSVKKLVKSAKIDSSRLVGCGVAVGGVVDPASGILIRSDPLGWNDVPLASMFSEKLGLRVRLEGRAVALLSAEQKSGSAISRKNVALISNGLWIGGAMMLDGRVVKGQSNMIGQIGHFAIHGNHERCVCGREGCLDAVASGLAILRQLKHIKLPEGAENKSPGERLRILSEIDNKKTSEISAAFKEAGRKMGYAIDALFSMLDLQQVLLTGVTHRQPAFIEGIRELLAEIRPEEVDWPVVVSRVTSNQSAIWLGLNSFVFSSALNIEQLKAA